MSQIFSSDETENLNQSTEASVTALAVQINAFVDDGTLDSRCAARLMKRLKKEAGLIVDNGGSTRTGRKELEEAFHAVDASLREHDAKLLVAAIAALRVSDSAGGNGA